MNDPKEYIQRQIFTAGTRARVSAIQYYEDDEHTYCPFCGSEQEQRSENGVFHIGCKQNCAGFQEELKLLEDQAMLQQILSLNLMKFKKDMKHSKSKLKNTLWTQVLKQQQNIIWN